MGTFSVRLDRLLARDHDAVGPKGRTTALVHDEKRPRAIVLMHGMSACPPQFDRYARELFARGHNVVVPRLPRHGHADRLSTALSRLRPEDLRSAVDEYVAVARDLGERVTIAGFSLGGLLAAVAAQHHDVDRCVAIAPFLGVAWIPNPIMKPLTRFMLRIPNRFEWWDPILRERQTPDYGYPRYATHAIAHAYGIATSLLETARTNAPAANRVVLVVNAREATVNNRAIRRLYARWMQHHPDRIEVVRLTGLPPSHDIIEPLRRSDLAERAFPQIIDAIDPGASPYSGKNSR